MTTAFKIAKDVVSRRNQDGTVILMKQNASGVFYKIDGIAAAVWADLESPKTITSLTARYAEVFPKEETRLARDLSALLQTLNEKQLIEATAESRGDFRALHSLPSDYLFGELREFDLEQIETEVLNESIYLDVFAGSDLRLKRDIEPLKGALEKISRLNGILFRWNPETAKNGDSSVHAGFVAQEVAAQMPELVRRDLDSGMLAVEYAKMNSYLVEAIKELKERVERLEKRLI